MNRFAAGALLVLLALAAPARAADEPVQLDTPTGTVHGSLLLPAAPARPPLVLLIAGSGPTDRDGNSAGAPGRNDSLKLLAQALAAAGFASIRYDKRGIAASAAAGPREADLRIGTYADDAAAWVRQAQRDGRFSGVAVLGHSEGSLIGMMAAQRLAPAANGGPGTPGGIFAFVSLAGVADPAPMLLRRQLAGKLPAELDAANQRILAELEQGRTADAVPPALAALYRPSVQPYLLSWFAERPAVLFAALPMPLLVVQGETDIQVGVDQARALVAANPRAELALIPGMNHVLKQVPLDPARQRMSHTDPTQPLAPGVADAITGFLRRAAETKR